MVTASQAMQTFMQEAPEHSCAWMDAVKHLTDACALEPKTAQLAYLAVLAANRLESGIPFHVCMAKAAGASREEVISAVLLGLPAVGQHVVQALPIAVRAYDEA